MLRALESLMIHEHPCCGPDCGGIEFRREQDALRRVAVLVAHGASTETVFRTVAAEVSKVLNTDVTLIGRYESDSTFTYLATEGDHLPRIRRSAQAHARRQQLGYQHCAQRSFRVDDV